MSSVRNAIGASDIAAEIHLLFQSPECKDKIIAIVEGKDDVKLYKSLFNLSLVKVYAICGKQHIVSVLNMLNPTYGKNLFAIKDADFDNLNSITYRSINNLFLTDTHDSETMMLCEEGVVDKIANEYDVDINNLKRIINRVLDDLKHYSYVKWMSETNNLKITFDCFNIASCYSSLCNGSISNCLNAIFIHPANININKVCEQDLLSFINNKEVDIYNLINGHDLCDGIRFVLFNANMVNGTIERDKLSAIMRAAYNENLFSRTNLHKNLLLWEQTYKYNILKTP